MVVSKDYIKSLVQNDIDVYEFEDKAVLLEDLIRLRKSANASNRRMKHKFVKILTNLYFTRRFGTLAEIRKTIFYQKI